MKLTLRDLVTILLMGLAPFVAILLWQSGPEPGWQSDLRNAVFGVPKPG